jgi:hypothetical protein
MKKVFVIAFIALMAIMPMVKVNAAGYKTDAFRIDKVKVSRQMDSIKSSGYIDVSYRILKNTAKSFTNCNLHVFQIGSGNYITKPVTLENAVVGQPNIITVEAPHLDVTTQIDVALVCNVTQGAQASLVLPSINATNAVATNHSVYNFIYNYDNLTKTGSTTTRFSVDTVNPLTTKCSYVFSDVVGNYVSVSSVTLVKGKYFAVVSKPAQQIVKMITSCTEAKGVTQHNTVYLGNY